MQWAKYFLIGHSYFLNAPYFIKAIYFVTLKYFTELHNSGMDFFLRKTAESEKSSYLFPPVKEFRSNA